MIKKANGGIAFYFGISFLLSSIGGVILLGIDLFKRITEHTPTPWSITLFFIFLTIVFGAVAYVLLRIGYEEIDDSYLHGEKR